VVLFLAHKIAAKSPWCQVTWSAWTGVSQEARKGEGRGHLLFWGWKYEALYKKRIS